MFLRLNPQKRSFTVSAGATAEVYTVHECPAYNKNSEGLLLSSRGFDFFLTGDGSVLGSELSQSLKKCYMTDVWSDERRLSAAAGLEDIEGMETAALA